MKHSLLPILTFSILLSSCAWSPKTVEDTVEIPTTTIAIEEIVPATTTEEKIPGQGTKTPVETSKTPTTDETENIPNPTISTEDLTKELDTFVDDITKGL